MIFRVCYDTDERFRAFFDIGMMISSFTSGLGGSAHNNGRFSHADKAAVFITLLRVTDRRALHGASITPGPQPVQMIARVIPTVCRRDGRTGTRFR